MFIQCKIMSSDEQPSSLHVMSSSMFNTPYASWINNDNVHQSMKTIYGNKNIHSSSSMAHEKVRYLPLNMCFTFQNNNYNNILKCVVHYCTLTPIGPPKQMDTYIVNGMTSLTS